MQAGLLLGQYEGKLDHKNRLAFPYRFKKVTGSNLIITVGYENSLIIVSEESWKTLLEGTEGRPFIQKEIRETQRFLLGQASFTKLDGKGRLIIPSYLREFAKIKNEIVFLGLSRYVELWDSEVWKVHRANLEKNIDKISERLTKSEKVGRNE